MICLYILIMYYKNDERMLFECNFGKVIFKQHIFYNVDTTKQIISFIKTILF